VSAGLDYSGVGPELSYWKSTNRATFVAATDAEALKGFRALTQLEGIIPGMYIMLFGSSVALESSHAVFGAMELAKTMSSDQDIVICLSGRGDKGDRPQLIVKIYHLDVQSVAEELPRLGPEIGWDLRF
jgi:tryptophan synthase